MQEEEEVLSGKPTPRPVSPPPTESVESLHLGHGVLKEQKERRREAMVAPPNQPHTQLRVHDLEAIPTNARDILKTAGDSRRQRHHMRTGGP